MGVYYVTVLQRLMSHLIVEANSQQEAEEKIRKQFHSTQDPFIGEWDETKLIEMQADFEED